MNMVIELALIFLGTSILMFLIIRGFSSKSRMNNRIKEFLPHGQAEKEANKEEKRLPFMKRLFLSVALLFKNIQFSKGTEKLLQEAGSELKPEEFFVLRIVTAVGFGLTAYLLGLSWYLFAFAIMIGFVIPGYLMKRKRKKRLKLLSNQLIDALGMMANSMRAGFSFMQSMQLIGKEIPDPLGPEFDRVVRQAGLGRPLEEVFEELVDRLLNNELEVVIQGILAQRKSGGNLSELLETMEDTIRGRVRILEELNTLTAQGKMSSWIITLLPVGLGLYLALVSKDYFRPMLEHPIGWILIFACIVSNIIGWVFIQKIIKIEV